MSRNKGRTKDQEWRRNLRKLGWSQELYELKLAEQHGVCAICFKKDPPRRLSADHNHKIKKARGLLCRACNLGLGSFRDNIENLLAAVYYLEHHASNGR